MTSEEFVAAIRVAVENGAQRSVVAELEHLSARPRDLDHRALASWYSELSSGERRRVQATVAVATKQATYNFLLVLDGLLAIEPTGDKGRLELWFEKSNQRILLNDRAQEELSSIFKALES